MHWIYGPHTCDGVVGKDNPLLLASNFSGRWPGLVGLLNTGACLEMLKRPFARAWTDAPDWTGEVSGVPQFYPLKTVDVLAAGSDAMHTPSPGGRDEVYTPVH